MRSLIIIALAFAISGCANLHGLSISQIPPQRGGGMIEAEVSKRIFFNLNFNNDYADEVYAELKNQCPNGAVAGIYTRDESFNYFIFVDRVIRAQAYCLRPQARGGRG